METPLAIVRCAHFLSVMFLFGAGTFLIGFAPPDLRARLSPSLRRAALVASLVALLSALLWLALEAASMSGEWAAALDRETLTDVLASTAFGAVWRARLPLLLLLAAALLATRAERWGLPTLIAAFALASLGWVDHAAMQAGAPGLSHRLNDGVHLMAASIWLGGLPPLVMSLALYGGGELRDSAAKAMARFSTVGHFSVAALIVSGVINIAMTSGRWPWPPDTPYRALLTAKLAMVGVMILMAIVNRYALVPRASQSRSALAALRALSLTETVLGCVVVALVSLFGLLDPA